MTEARSPLSDPDERVGELAPPDLLPGRAVIWRCPQAGCETAERGTARRPAGAGVCDRHATALRRVDG